MRVKFFAFCLFFFLWLFVNIPVGAASYLGAKFEPEKGCYLGAYVLQDSSINGSMEKFNELTDKKHASFFRYVGYGQQFPQEWVNQVKKVGAVPHIAFEPNHGLDKVKDDEYLRKFARDAFASGVPIFLRYASEMNGNWAAYSGDPAKYKEKFRLVHKVMEEEAPNVAMVWTVFTFPQWTITSYYPGDDYVDWVGVNVYNVIYHNNDISFKADHEDPLDLISFVYKTYGSKKPIQISEYGATHYTTTDNKEYITFAQSKIMRMYSGIKAKYSMVKGIYYFDVNNVKDAIPERRINNYALTDNASVLKTYQKVINDDYFLTSIHDNRLSIYLKGKVISDKLVYSKKKGRILVPLKTIALYLGIGVSWDEANQNIKMKGNNTEIIMYLNKNYAKVNKETRNLDISPELRSGRTYVSLRDICELLGYKIMYDKGANRVEVY